MKLFEHLLLAIIEIICFSIFIIYSINIFIAIFSFLFLSSYSIFNQIYHFVFIGLPFFFVSYIIFQNKEKLKGANNDQKK